MTVTRRRFLRSGAMTALLAGLALDSMPLSLAQTSRESAPSQDFPSSSGAEQGPALYFKRETFEPYVNGVFKLGAGAKAVAATLVSVRDCPPNTKSKVTPKSLPTESFAITFRAEGKLTALKTIYDVEHGALGKFPLFLTRRSGPRGSHFYEAVFNRTL